MGFNFYLTDFEDQTVIYKLALYEEHLALQQVWSN